MYVKRITGHVLLIGVATWSANAQQWEIGAAVGYGAYHNGSIISGAGTAEAGIRNRFAAGAVIGEQPYQYIGGEVRYLYQDGDPFLAAGGRKLNIQGQSHAVHYDVLVHVRDREQRLRPFIAVGIGAKWFRTTGPPPPDPQPLQNIGTITGTDQTRLLVTIGGGVKYDVREHVRLRFDFRDYITPFPGRILAPSTGATGRGVLNQFTPMVGISYVF